MGLRTEKIKYWSAVMVRQPIYIIIFSLKKIQFLSIISSVLPPLSVDRNDLFDKHNSIVKSVSVWPLV